MPVCRSPTSRMATSRPREFTFASGRLSVAAPRGRGATCFLLSLAVLAVLAGGCSDDDGQRSLVRTVIPATATRAAGFASPEATIAPGASPTLASTSAPSPASGLADEALRNATYRSEFAPGGQARLTNGEFVGVNAPLMAELRITLVDVRAAGDLDGNSSPDAAVVLMSKTQGTTGTFYELFAVLNQGGQANPLPPAFLGDRVVVNAIEVANRQITLRMRVQGPNDGACCPTLDATRVYAVSGGVLTLVSRTD